MARFDPSGASLLTCGVKRAFHSPRATSISEYGRTGLITAEWEARNSLVVIRVQV